MSWYAQYQEVIAVTVVSHKLESRKVLFTGDFRSWEFSQWAEVQAIYNEAEQSQDQSSSERRYRERHTRSRLYEDKRICTRQVLSM
jgi:hypothetical protein